MMVKRALKAGGDDGDDQDSVASDDEPAPSTEGVMGVVRQALNYVQTTAALAGFTARGSQLLADAMGLATVGDGISFDAYPVQCALQWSWYSRYFAYLCLPLVIVSAAAFIHAARFLLCRQRYVRCATGCGPKKAGNPVG